MFSFSFVIGIPATHGKPTSYSLRVDNTVPLVTQAPAVQPLQIRPGVLSQVGNNLLFLHMYCRPYSQVRHLSTCDIPACAAEK